MDLVELYNKIQKLEYHQSLLIQMISINQFNFYRLVIAKSLDEKQVRGIHKLCEKLSNNFEEQKAEGFVYYHPLYHEFNMNLPSNVHASELIEACINQGLYLPLMLELKKYI